MNEKLFWISYFIVKIVVNYFINSKSFEVKLTETSISYTVKAA